MSLRVAAILALASAAQAHSWIEEVQAISDNGSYYGDYGYLRGYMSRTDPGFNGYSDLWLLPSDTSGRTRINSSDLLCHPSQRTSNYSTEYPKLQITPEGFMAMKYLENGHVTLPQNQLGKPKGAGTVFVYATTSPSDTETIVDVLDWTSTGSGGDKRGTLISSESFDDGRCHQINSGTISIQRQAEFPDRVAGQPTSNVEQWCETDVQIPASVAKAGDTVTLYWVWQWPTAPGADPTYPDGKDEYYTSCLDVEIVDKLADTGAPIHTILQQDPQSTAVTSYKSRTAYTESPLVTLAGATGSSSVTIATTTAASSPLTSAALTTSASATPIATMTSSTSSITMLYANSSISSNISTATSSSSNISSATTSNSSLSAASSTSSTPPNTLPYITYSLSYLPTYTTSLPSTLATSTSASSTMTASTTTITDPDAGQALEIASSLSAASASANVQTVTDIATVYTTVTASTPAIVTVTATAPTATATVSATASASVTGQAGAQNAQKRGIKRSAKFRLA